jgi:hypothetical protein
MTDHEPLPPTRDEAHHVLPIDLGKTGLSDLTIGFTATPSWVSEQQRAGRVLRESDLPDGTEIMDLATATHLGLLSGVRLDLTSADTASTQEREEQ